MAYDHDTPQDEHDNAPTLKMRRVFPISLEITPETPPERATGDDTEASAFPPNTNDEQNDAALAHDEGVLWSQDETPSISEMGATDPPDAVSNPDAPTILLHAELVADVSASDATEQHSLVAPVTMPPSSSDETWRDGWSTSPAFTPPPTPPAASFTTDVLPRWVIAEEPLPTVHIAPTEPLPVNTSGLAASVPPLPNSYSPPPLIDEGYQPALDRAPEPLAQVTRPIDDEEDTTVKMFEYCRVVIDSGQYSQTQGRYPYFVRVTLDYYGAESAPSYKFNQDTDKMDGPDKTWGRMLGLLGAAGWEMLNITIGKAKDLSILEAMAYFKRPVEEGREIDQPAISL